MIYLVDIDGVLCNETLGDYKESEPNFKNIEKVNKLFDDGHTIKIFTGRGSATGIDWRSFTDSQLKGWGVKYHQLILGKPVCDFIIDDKNISLKDWENEKD